MSVAAAVTPSPFWFLTRGTGVVSLVLLTITVALGVANVRRTRVGEVPRFVLDSIHRSAGLLAVSFVAVHVATTVLDGFAPVTLLDAVIPFRSAYRPLWVGLGAVAFDLLIAVVITSLLRRRLGYRAWRTTHWLVYASWPVALVHGLGAGSDAKTHWMLLLVTACVAVVLVAVAIRVSAGWPEHLVARTSAAGAAALLPLGLLAWLPGGPLAAGWARQAGTPAALLASAHSRSGSAAGAAGSQRTSGGAGLGASPSSTIATVGGRIRQVQVQNGLMLVDISLAVHGQRLDNLHIRIKGPPLAGGGVQMTSSRVTLGPSSNPDQYSGRVSGLQGTDLAATVSDSAGSTLSLVAHLQIAPGPGGVSGTVSVSPRRSP
jgi:hypothetical protein